MRLDWLVLGPAGWFHRACILDVAIESLPLSLFCCRWDDEMGHAYGRGLYTEDPGGFIGPPVRWLILLNEWQ